MPKKKRPTVLKGETTKVRTSCGSLYVTLDKDGGELCEVHLRMGKTGSCFVSTLNMVSVLTSTILQSEYDRAYLVKMFKRHMRDVSCGERFNFEGVNYKSCWDVVGKLCMDSLKEEKNEKG